MTNHQHRDAIELIYTAAVSRVHAGAAVSRNLCRLDAGALEIAGARFEVSSKGVYSIAIGKAAFGMSSAAAAALGDLLVAGIAVTKEEHGDPPERVTLLRGSHPVPDQRSIAAGESVLQFARSVPAGATVICLISGGGSALVEVPTDGVTLSELRRITRHLLGGGASIQEMNVVRSRLSRFKAGGLLHELRHTTVHNLIVSDVLGDDLNAIASGPTVPSSGTGDAQSVLNEYGLNAALPTPASRTSLDEPHTAIIANVSMAVDAAAERALALGLTPFVLTRFLAGEAREVGRFIAAIAHDAEHGRSTLAPGTCLIAGGETVVTLTGNGVGGRNTEAALSAALALPDSDSSAIGFLATDGDDGVSGAAGAIVDGMTVCAASATRAREALRDNDSFTYLEGAGASVTTGPSGTNVNDLIIAIIGT